MMLINLTKSFGEVLMKLRVKYNYSQEYIALEAELEQAYISLLECGRNNPSLNAVASIAHAFNLKASELIAMVEEHGKI